MTITSVERILRTAHETKKMFEVDDIPTILKCWMICCCSKKNNNSKKYLKSKLIKEFRTSKGLKIYNQLMSLFQETWNTQTSKLYIHKNNHIQQPQTQQTQIEITSSTQLSASPLTSTSITNKSNIYDEFIQTILTNAINNNNSKYILTEDAKTLFYNNLHNYFTKFLEILMNQCVVNQYDNDVQNINDNLLNDNEITTFNSYLKEEQQFEEKLCKYFTTLSLLTKKQYYRNRHLYNYWELKEKRYEKGLMSYHEMALYSHEYEIFKIYGFVRPWEKQENEKQWIPKTSLSLKYFEKRFKTQIDNINKPINDTLIISLETLKKTLNIININNLCK